ncbi:DEAD-domain-containing protein [Hypoxylon sp. FL1857]|nr:DEAD-domain-containing protein [Hypoxylon sp. FL1857]
MFKFSIQRQARLGSLARRQLSTLAPRQIRSRPLVASYQRWPQAELQLAPLRQIAIRLYSQESAVARPETDIEDLPGGIYNVNRFKDLTKLGVDERIIRAITDDMKYDTMTEVQSLTINPALKGIDLVAQAKTGTGKTLGFLVPVFQRVIAADPSLAAGHNRRGYASSEDVRAIILSPTRELAEQIGVEAKKLARHTGIIVQTAVGGTRKKEALWRMRRQGCHVLIATPGRLQDILSDPESGVRAPRVQAFVLDEADRMLDVGFSESIRDILELLPPIEEVDRQTLLYSATIPRDVVHLAKDMVKTDNFEFVQTISPDETPTHERVPQHLVTVPSYENWFPAIMEIAEQARIRSRQDPEALPFKAIVFFSNTATVEFANRVFRNTAFHRGPTGIPVFDIHSKLNQAQRTRNADAFRRAKTGILLSSDVTARGMDFPRVSHVIQAGLPPDRDQYIHRVGRTGRAGAPGEGWLILAEEEIPEARKRLTGLPIKPVQSLETAEHRVGTGEPPAEVSKFFDDVSQAYKKVPADYFRSVYNALLGQKFGRYLQARDVVKLLNNWCMNGLGWSETPALAPRSAQNRGLANIPGLRIGYDVDKSDSSNFSSNSGFGSGYGSGFRSSDRGSNPFDDRGSNPFDDRGSNPFDDRGSRDRGSRFGDNFGSSRNDRRNGRSDGRFGSSRNDRRGGGFGNSFGSRNDRQSRDSPRATF